MIPNLTSCRASKDIGGAGTALKEVYCSTILLLLLCSATLNKIERSRASGRDVGIGGEIFGKYVNSTMMIPGNNHTSLVCRDRVAERFEERGVVGAQQLPIPFAAVIYI